jgi:hypothetical protein
MDPKAVVTGFLDDEDAVDRRAKPLLSFRPQAGVDSGTKRNGLSKADLDVSAKLPEQCLERGEEAEAFPGR